MDFYNRNLELLSQTQPDLAAQIVAYEPPQSAAQEITVVAAKNGSYTFKKTVSENVYTAHSAYNPEKEAARMVDSYLAEIKEFSNIVMMGCGFFYQIQELLKRTPNKFDFMLVVEHDAAVFKNALRCLDLSDVLGRPEIFFAVAESPVSLFQFLQSKGISIVANGMTILKHTTLCKTTDYYAQVEKQVNDVCTWAKVNISAQVKTTDIYCKNIFKNIPHMLKNPGVKHIFDLFKGVPAVIVAAGPSLSKNIDYLKEVKNRFLIVAVDTALKVLLSHGIEPHFVASIDYTPDNMRYFEGVGKLNTYLLADPEVYPDIFAKYEGPKIAVDLLNKSLCFWLQSQGIEKGAMGKGLSVAHTCFEIAVRSACEPVIFIGQDLAYTGGLSHSKGAAMTIAVDNDNLEEGQIKVKDVFGGDVVTSTAMSVFLNHFMEKIYSYRVETIDATEGGAAIEGAQIMSLREVIDKYGAKGFDDVWGTIAEALISEDRVDMNKVKSNAKKTIKQFRQFADFTAKAEALMQKLLENLREENIDIKKVSQNLIKWREVSSQMHHFDILLRLVRDNITDALILQAKKSLVITSLGDLREDTEKKKVQKAADRDRFFYGRLKESALFMVDEFEKLYGGL